ncbi:MAG: anti-sigma F factor [Firmicutes bacterium]|nr:anti-sigma F factor [Bacillota bacterium]
MKQINPINFMRLELAAISTNESFARSTVCAFATRLDPTMDQLDDIKTAVSEAVTNAVVHAYDGNDGIILIEAELFNDHISIRISDSGTGIGDLDKMMQPFVTTKPEEERSGMGFTVMQSFMDSLNVESHVGRGTTVSMKKFFAQKSRQAAGA